MSSVPQIEWMCTKCGVKMIKSSMAGRPAPGRCLKNNGKEHRWVKNRELR